MDEQPKSKFARKRSKIQTSADFQFIAGLMEQGYTLAGMKEALEAKRPYTLSIAQIAKITVKVREQWVIDAREAGERQRAASIAKLNRIIREAWQGWERSKAEKVEQSQKKRDAARNGEGGFTEGQMTKSNRDGDPKFLQTILQAEEQINKILGVNAPQRIEHSGIDGQPIEVEQTMVIDEDAAARAYKSSLLRELATQRN